MKYWLLTTEFPPEFGGGIGTYCEQWSKILQQQGHEVTVFLPNKSVNGYVISDRNGIRIVEFSPYFKDTSAYLGYETMISNSFAEVVKEFIEKEGTPDWLEAQEYNGIAYFILQRKQLGDQIFAGLKVLVTCHAPSFLYFEFNHINNYKLPYFWIGEMEKYGIQAADVCISPSQYLVDRLKERMELNRKIEVLHNPFEFQSGELNSGNLEKKAIFLAKLSPSKGILQTLKTFKQLWDSGFKYQLTLIGDPYFFYQARHTMMATLIKEEYPAYLQNGLLQIAGKLSPEEVKKEIRKATVVLVPSTVDNFPYTVVECMAANKVVLASKQGGHQEIIQDGVNGFLFDHEKFGSFAEKVKQVFDLSESELKNIGEKAALTIQEKCDPKHYFVQKWQILQGYQPSEKAENEFIFTRNIPVVSAIETVNSKTDDPELLSVVIPFYNLGSLIRQTIDSVLASEYKNLEILIVNDGSTDPESLQVLEVLTRQDKITVLSQPNQGLAAARNLGAKNAKGRFLAFLDADDLVHKSYYSKAIALLKAKTNVHFVGSWVQYFEGSDTIWPALNPEPPYLLYHNMVNSSGLVYKKQAFLQAGLNDSQFVMGMEDYDSVIGLVKNGFRGVSIPDILFYYRVRKNSMARGFNSENKSYLYKLLAEKHNNFYSKFAAELSNLLNANGPGFVVENPTLDYHLYKGSSPGSKVIRKLYAIIKHKPLLRRLALKTYNKLKFLQ